MAALIGKSISTLVSMKMWMPMYYVHLSLLMMSSAQSGSDERVRIIV